jgi:hypothetical protein
MYKYPPRPPIAAHNAACSTQKHSSRPRRLHSVSRYLIWPRRTSFLKRAEGVPSSAWKQDRTHPTRNSQEHVQSEESCRSLRSLEKKLFQLQIFVHAVFLGRCHLRQLFQLTSIVRRRSRRTSTFQTCCWSSLQAGSKVVDGCHRIVNTNGAGHAETRHCGVWNANKFSPKPSLSLAQHAALLQRDNRMSAPVAVSVVGSLLRPLRR